MLDGETRWRIRHDLAPPQLLRLGLRERAAPRRRARVVRARLGGPARHRSFRARADAARRRDRAARPARHAAREPGRGLHHRAPRAPRAQLRPLDDRPGEDDPPARLLQPARTSSPTPQTELDIVSLLDWCGAHGIAAIPFGGGSSVVGGVNPPADAKARADARPVAFQSRARDRQDLAGRARAGGRARPQPREAAQALGPHAALFPAGLGVLLARRLDRHPRRRPLRHRLHPDRRPRRSAARGHPRGHARIAPPARLGRGPEPGPPVHRLRGVAGHHHRGLDSPAPPPHLPPGHHRRLPRLGAGGPRRARALPVRPLSRPTRA